MIEQMLNGHGQNTGNLAPTINVCSLTREEQSSSLVLPVGSQRQAIQAATLAKEIGAPINRLLTARTQAMRDIGEGGVFRLGSQAECVRIFLDRHFRWMKHRGIPVVYVWCREYSSHHGEHFHLGYHQIDELDAPYIEQAAKWFEQDLGAPVKDADTIAQSVEGGWNIKRCIHGNNSGHRIAAYITKAEPSEIITKWGKEKPNKRKPMRSVRGGNGPIEGNGKHAYRWGTSLLIGRTQRDRNGYMH